MRITHKVIPWILRRILLCGLTACSKHTRMSEGSVYMRLHDPGAYRALAIRTLLGDVADRRQADAGVCVECCR